MFFEKNKSEKLDENLFKNPTAEYRGAPFWSWNTKLEKGALEKHIEAFEKMGLGGFNMHARVGLGTEYLGEEFMEMVKFCTEKAEEKGLYAWLYDEDKWPSGFAGGKVTKEKIYRQRYVNFSVKEIPTTKSQEEFEKNGTPMLLASYDICLDDEGYLISYDIIDKNAKATGTKWFAYAMTEGDRIWFNGQSYIDPLDNAATEKFIEYTHEEYKKVVGDKFGKSVPYIFTDEPRANLTEEYSPLAFSTDTDDVHFAWSKRFAEKYKEAYGEDIIPELPMLVWQKPGDAIHSVRYKYYRLVAELFNENFMKPYGEWCRNNNIGFTGHVMAEDDLISQTAGFGGETMPAYKYMDVPGIDMLCADKNFNTAKQCQSVVRQLGKEGMLSELYGVTGWDFDFRGHKIEGDWQAAMGVTHRVHHLTWLTMEGAAKRDYPATIGYQSPWYEKYSYVEDHFARLATVLSRGKPVVKVGVIHPVESFWLNVGPQDKTSEAKLSMEKEFAQLTEWLALGNIDFDFISESLLPELCEKGANPLKVGEMEYDAVIVPSLTTIRKSTLERLEVFASGGGNLIFIGNAPEYVDLKKSDEAEKLSAQAKIVLFNKSEILSALEENRELEIINGEGNKTDNLVYQIREDGDVYWLFIAHAKLPACIDTVAPEKLNIKLKGEFIPALYDTVDGEVKPLKYAVKNGFTIIEKEVFSHDSLLIKLSKNDDISSKVENITRETVKTIDFKKAVTYSLSEPNALLLDRAEYSLDGEQFNPEEEILKISVIVKERLGWPSSGSDILQPWLIEEKPAEHTLSLKTKFESEIKVRDAFLAIEKPENLSVKFNGKEISTKSIGYFVDESIKTLKLPLIKKGENTIELTMPFDKLTFPEWMYILGEFGVKVNGASTVITEKPDKVGFNTLTEQNLPFYTGNVSYETEIDVPDCENVKVRATSYRGGLIEVLVDDKETGIIVYPPYTLDIGKIEKGTHKLTFKLYGHRNNAFGPLHNFDASQKWVGPGLWFTEGDSFGYEYNLKSMGILKSPTVIFEK